MAPQRLTQLPTVLKQRLLVEFASLKQACPQGVFVSLTPGDPVLWAGVIFVRKGPYSPSILRFHISFPPTYPSNPPLITFSTDIFHPLVTTSAQPEGTVSAADVERLPPGGFSLRHGFPEWFDRRGVSQGRNVGIYEVLRYVRSTFDTAEVLDKVPLAAAGHSSAWHAWRHHRVKEGIVYPSPKNDKDTLGEGESSDDMGVSSRDVSDGYQRLPRGSSVPMVSKRPEEWNWDGVWEVRVKKGIDGSLTDGMLFGKDGKETGDNLIHFLNMDTEQYGGIKEELMKSIESTASQRRGVA